MNIQTNSEKNENNYIKTEENRNKNKIKVINMTLKGKQE